MPRRQTLQSQAIVRRARKTESITQRNTYAHVELPYKALDVLCLVKVPEYLLGKPVLIQNWSDAESALEASRWKYR